MKRSILVSSLLLAAAGCANPSDELTDVHEEAIEARADLIDRVFVSKETFEVKHYRYANGAAIAYDAKIKLRLTFIRADNYELDDTADGLDYEILVEEVDQDTGEVTSRDSTYFAKRQGSVLHRIYDCDSTRECSSEFNNARMYIYDMGNGGVGLKLRQENNFHVLSSNGYEDKKEILFSAVVPD